MQDFYIQVKCINLQLAEVDEIEPYLFKILRNLHYSRLRQKGRSPISELSIAEYDSLERGLVATDRRDLFLVHANLQDICEFVCQRKSTAARASVFILRFFFGYYPSEVMKVVLASRTAIDRSLRLARQEAPPSQAPPYNSLYRASGATERYLRHGRRSFSCPLS